MQPELGAITFEQRQSSLAKKDSRTSGRGKSADRRSSKTAMNKKSSKHIEQQWCEGGNNEASKAQF